MKLETNLAAPPKLPTKLPVKKGINLAQREKHTRSIVTILVSAAVIAVLSLAIARHGILDQFDKLFAAEAAYDRTHEQYVQMQEALERYDEVEAAYRSYSRKWMRVNEDDTAEEKAAKAKLFVSVDREDVLDLVESELMTRGKVKSLSISGDALLVSMSGMDLKQISKMMVSLHRNPVVRDASLTIASTEENTYDAALDFALVISVQPLEEDIG